MPNDYFSASGSPSTGANLTSAAVRSEFAAIQAAFDLLPDLTSVGNRVPHINAGSTAIITTSGFTFDGTDLVVPAKVKSVSFMHAGHATALVAGGSSTTAIFASSSQIGVIVGSGAPTMSAPKGCLYLRSDGSSTSTRAYINTDGGTSWTPVTTAT